MSVNSPLPRRTAWKGVAGCVGRSFTLIVHGRVHGPRDMVGTFIEFADGTVARVYRETVVHRRPAAPCVLFVVFRLRAVHGRGHAVFRAESILNTPLFVGFPGFVSKLWMAHDGADAYRGLYEWDAADRAETYARSLWRVLALVSVRGSIDFKVVPGASREEILADPTSLDSASPTTGEWWRVVSVSPATSHLSSAR